jgi:hypothetical protein
MKREVKQLQNGTSAFVIQFFSRMSLTILFVYGITVRNPTLFAFIVIAEPAGAFSEMNLTISTPLADG